MTTEARKIERVVSIVQGIDPELAAYVRECYDSLDEIVNHYMQGFPNSIAVDDCLVRGAAVLCDISPNQK